MPAAVTQVKPEERAGDGFAPMYVNPRPWILANVTAVTVDCRRRAAPLSVTVSHGYALTATVFRGLFDTAPSAWMSRVPELAAAMAWSRPTAVESRRRPESGGRTAARPDGAGDVERRVRPKTSSS